MLPSWNYGCERYNKKFVERKDTRLKENHEQCFGISKYIRDSFKPDSLKKKQASMVVCLITVSSRHQRECSSVAFLFYSFLSLLPAFFYLFLSLLFVSYTHFVYFFCACFPNIYFPFFYSYSLIFYFVSLLLFLFLILILFIFFCVSFPDSYFSFLYSYSLIVLYLLSVLFVSSLHCPLQIQILPATCG